MVEELLSQIRNSSGVAVARVVTNATTAASVLMTVSHVNLPYKSKSDANVCADIKASCKGFATH